MAAPQAEEEAVRAPVRAPHLAGVVQPLVLVVLAPLAPLLLLQAVVVPLVLRVRASLAPLVLLRVVVVLAVRAPVRVVEALPLLHLLSRPSCSAAMARSTP